MVDDVVCLVDALAVAQRVFKIEIVEAAITELLLVLLEELLLDESPAVLERLVLGIECALCFHNEHLVDFVVLTLHDEEVGRIAADVFPLSVGVLLEAVDAELSELSVAIVIYFQIVVMDALLRQHFVKEERLKVAVYMIGQIVIAAVLVRVAAVLSAVLFCLFPHTCPFESFYDSQYLGWNITLTSVIPDDAFHLLLLGDKVFLL